MTKSVSKIKDKRGKVNKKYNEDYKKSIAKLIEDGKAIIEQVYGTITTSEVTNNELLKQKKELHQLQLECEILKIFVKIQITIEECN